MEEIANQLVPIVLFLAVAATFCVKYYLAYRTRRDLQATVRNALERGQPLTPEILDRLGQPSRPKNADLRQGVIGIAIGLGIAAFGFALGHEEAVRPLLAIGTVPLLIGLAYLALWRMEGPKS
jgi:hypothetical protein